MQGPSITIWDGFGFAEVAIFSRVTGVHTCAISARLNGFGSATLPVMRTLIASVVLFVLSSFVFTLIGADLSGNWSAAVTLDAGSGTAKFTFKQSGDKLTGTYTGQIGTANVMGTVKGSDVEWSFDSEQAGKISYKGTLGADGKINGTVEYGQLGAGKFTAEKDK